MSGFPFLPISFITFKQINMSIRLNKALRELNIGLQTAVEFLEKKSELGEVKSDLSYKLSEGQYKALVEAFKQDA